MRGTRPAGLLLGCVLGGLWPGGLEAHPAAASPLAAEAAPARRGLPGATVGQRPVPFLDSRLCPLEKRLLADADDGRLDGFSLWEAALVAGGVERDDVLARYHRRLAALVEELRRSVRRTGPPRQRAQDVFEFMHRRVLTGGYGEDCTDLRAALDRGRFNCVSASVLFNGLAGELGLTVCGLEVPGHAMSRVSLPGGPLDVETTCPRWFALLGDAPRGGMVRHPHPLQRSAKLAEQATDRTGPVAPFQAREVSGVQLIAMIYYNRGVDLLAEGQFERAAAANAKALRLDPRSRTARENLLATMNNWAIALGRSGRYAEAVDLLRKGLRLEAAHEAFAANYVHLHHRWVEHLCRLERFSEALGVLGSGAAAMPGEPYFREAAAEIRSRRRAQPGQAASPRP